MDCQDQLVSPGPQENLELMDNVVQEVPPDLWVSQVEQDQWDPSGQEDLQAQLDETVLQEDPGQRARQEMMVDQGKWALLEILDPRVSLDHWDPQEKGDPQARTELWDRRDPPDLRETLELQECQACQDPLGHTASKVSVGQ